MKLGKEYFDDIRGAAYIPVRTCNAYQQWKEYSHEVAVRDMGFAKKLNLNSIRLWLSYELWLENPKLMEDNFDDYLSVIEGYGIRVMPSIFECCGRDPSRETMDDKDQFTCDAVRSPGTEITNDCTRWHEPFRFLDWFMAKYRFDKRILAVEVTNEPKNVNDQLFAIALLKRAKSYCHGIPVTLGCETYSDNLLYGDYIDIYQTHENMPLSEDYLDHQLRRCKIVEQINGKPFWVTEWQQIRQGGWGFDKASKVTKKGMRPNHKTIAPVLHKYNAGNFVWNLMLRPAYLARPRSVGTFNGIFHEDGSVYSLEDARAIAGDDKLELKENHTLPECFDRVAAMSEE